MKDYEKSFFGELLTLCEKYQVNVTDANIHFNHTDYKVDIHGQWSVNDDVSVVNVYKQELETVANLTKNEF